MKFYADLHIHSRYSRATSRDLCFSQLYAHAWIKGLSVVGTGDFTHPGWGKEIREQLEPAEDGLFRLNSAMEAEVRQGLPVDGGAWKDSPAPRFILQVEISTIYKKAGRTRKVHHLCFVPGLEAAEKFTAALARIGNVRSDGRPILGLDSRNLLEILLASGKGAFLIPAHIWTPWFSVLGASSGFDSIEECYGDLAPHVFALETGLSSDPAMNRRVSALDRYRLVSNSDAHSPAKLGREATVFDTEQTYGAIRTALETGTGYAGTLEFFPEEGKYHLDGHRACGVCWTPAETRAHKGVCPVCGGKITVGVVHRVEALADRSEKEGLKRVTGHHSLIPLAEVISEILGVGPNSGKVKKTYEQIIKRLGPELMILDQIPFASIQAEGSSIFVEAITRMRAGRVIRQAGFDGQFGVIHLFKESERTERSVLRG